MSHRCFATVVTRSYLADARALAQSIRRFHDDPIYVLCIDDPTGFIDSTAEPFTLLTLDDVLPQEDRSILFYYTAFEMCCALRAWLHRYIHDYTNAEKWIFLDSDICVASSLEPAFAALDEAVAGLLTPHCLTAAPPHLINPVETSLLRYGLHNAGFLALRRSSDTAAFIEWFVTRLRSHSFFVEYGMYCDQLWLNFAPDVFPNIQVWRHPGANVAYWNIHERVITQAGERYQVDGQELLFMHFSRWNIDNPEDWSFGRPINQASNRDAIAALGREYRDVLLRCNYRECRQWPYGFDRFSNGRTITKAMRRAYYEDWVAGKASAESPFEHPEWFPAWKFPPDIRPLVLRWTKPVRAIRNKLRGR